VDHNTGYGEAGSTMRKRALNGGKRWLIIKKQFGNKQRREQAITKDAWDEKEKLGKLVHGGRMKDIGGQKRPEGTESLTVYLQRPMPSLHGFFIR